MRFSPPKCKTLTPRLSRANTDLWESSRTCPYIVTAINKLQPHLVSDSQMSARHESRFCEAVNPVKVIAICVQWKASAGSRKILTGVCLFCKSIAAVSCKKEEQKKKHTLSYVSTRVVTMGLCGITWKHVVLIALTDTLYAEVVLIFPMIICTDTENRTLFSAKTRQSITHRAWESNL